MPSWLSKNSPFSKIAENVPGVGHAAAFFHAKAGNHDEAQRAATTCTKNTVKVFKVLAKSKK
jgi:hypothetical protein